MHFKGKNRGLLIAVAVALGITISNADTSMAAATEPSASTAAVVWIEYSPGQSLTSAILHESAASTTYAARVRAWVPVWEREVSAGKDPGLPGIAGQPKARQLTTLNELNTDLNRQAVGAVVPAIDYGNPNTFPIRGQRDPSGWYWTASFENDLDACGSTCDLTDRYRSNVTINPGATVTQVVSRNLYFPDSGNFQNTHFRMFAVCSGVVCDAADTGDLPATGRDYLDHYGDRHEKVLTIGLALWTYVTPLGTYIADAGKTHDCTGESVVIGNGCYYSY